MGLVNGLLRLSGFSCPNCHKKLQTEDFNQEKKTITCSQCFTLIDPAQMQNSRYQQIDKSQIVPSKAVQMSVTGGIVTVSKRWFSASSIFLLFFAVFWIGMISFITRTMLASGQTSQSFLFLSPFWLAAGFLAFKTMQAIFNVTTIQFKSSRMIVIEGPVSFAKPKVYDVAKIANFSVNKNITRDNEGRRATHYGVYVHLTNGEHEKICAAKNMDEAIYIEHLIEKHLGLKDDTKFDRVEA